MRPYKGVHMDLNYIKGVNLGNWLDRKSVV